MVLKYLVDGKSVKVDKEKLHVLPTGSDLGLGRSDLGLGCSDLGL